MPKERLVGSYLIRFSELDNHLNVYLQNLKTGEQLSFENWIAAWLFLEGNLDLSSETLLELQKVRGS